jgi:rubrerythrin
MKKGLIMAKTLNDLLDVSIRDEINAQKFYRIMSEKAGNSKLKEIFISLANEENGHELILKDMKEMEIFDDSVEVDEESLEKIEGAHIIDDAEPIDDMTIERALQIALKRENKAIQVYRQMAESTPNEEIMRLLFRIVSDEQRHINIISQNYKMYSG